MKILRKISHEGNLNSNLAKRSFGVGSKHQAQNLKNVVSSKWKEDRSDTLKYSYLQSDSTFDQLKDKLHQDLLIGLKENNYTYLSRVQDFVRQLINSIISQAVKRGILEGNNMILNSETGSGKTLAYLLPILNQLFTYKDTLGKKGKTSKFTMTPANEEQMFLSAEDINYKEKQEYSRLSFNKTTHQQPKGAIILSYSKELLNQIYVQARMLDLRERLMINRATSSLQMKTPIVEYLTPNKDDDSKTKPSDDDLFEIGLKNVINNASWRITDILLATPVVMSHIINHKDRFDPYDINPAVIVIDEYDELVQNPELYNHLHKIFRKFATFNDKNNPLSMVNRQRQFIFTGATIPKTLPSGHDAINTLKDWIPGIEQIKTDNCHKTSQLLQYEWVDVDKANLVSTKCKATDDHNINLLIDIIKRSKEVLRSRNIMVFIEQKKTIDAIQKALAKEKINHIPYMQEIGVYGRAEMLRIAQSKEGFVMVCTNIGARGLDTMTVDHVIQFDFAKNVVDYIHRVGRTGRMGQRGHVTNFIRKTDYELEQRIRQMDEANQSYDKLIGKRKFTQRNPKSDLKGYSNTSGSGIFDTVIAEGGDQYERLSADDNKQK